MFNLYVDTPRQPDDESLADIIRPLAHHPLLGPDGPRGVGCRDSKGTEPPFWEVMRVCARGLGGRRGGREGGRVPERERGGETGGRVGESGGDRWREGGREGGRDMEVEGG